MVTLRRTIGDVLRDERRGQSRTLREVSSTARVSLGYLSEVERGQKEASSELLASICGALDVPLSHVLGEVTRRVAVEEAVAGHVPVGRIDAAGRRTIGARAYQAEGVVPAVTAEPLASAVLAVPPADPSALEALADDAPVEHVPGAEQLSAETFREFAVELEGLPEEFELIVRRRLAPAA